MVDTSIDDSETVESSPDVIVSVGLDGKSYHRPAPSEPAEDMSPVPVKTATRPTVHAHHPNTTRPEQCGCGMSVKPTPPPASRSNANSHDNTRTTGKRYQSIRHICQKYANLCRKQLINAKLRLARNVVISTKTATLQRIPDVSSPPLAPAKRAGTQGFRPFCFPGIAVFRSTATRSTARFVFSDHQETGGGFLCTNSHDNAATRIPHHVC